MVGSVDLTHPAQMVVESRSRDFPVEWTKETFSTPDNVDVVVNFLSQVIFAFLLFLGMVIYANEVKTKEKEKLPEIKN